MRQLIGAGWPEGVVINVNFPNCEPGAVKGSVTAQGFGSGAAAHRGSMDTRGAYSVVSNAAGRPPQSDLGRGQFHLHSLSTTPIRQRSRSLRVCQAPSGFALGSVDCTSTEAIFSLILI